MTDDRGTDKLVFHKDFCIEFYFISSLRQFI